VTPRKILERQRMRMNMKYVKKKRAKAFLEDVPTKNDKEFLECMVAEDVFEDEEIIAWSALDNPRFLEWVNKIRQEFIVKGFFEKWYAMDGRWGRVEERKSKGDYLFEEERSAFLLWLRLGTDDCGLKLWQETHNMLKMLNMDFSDYLTRMMFPLFSVRDPAVIFELVGLKSKEVGFRVIFPFLAPPPWFELLNYAIFYRPLNRLPVYRLDFTDNLEFNGIIFLCPDLTKESRIWLVKHVIEAYERLITGEGKGKEHLEWWLLNNLSTPMGIREIGRKYDRTASTVDSAVKSAGKKLLYEDGLTNYMSKVRAPFGVSWLEATQIAKKAFAPVRTEGDDYLKEFLNLDEIMLLVKNFVDVAQDITRTQNYSKLGICPIPGNVFELFVHQNR
jgi:hypothetical protein